MASVLLVDGPAVAYRSHFALARWSLTTASGQSTAATYGFVTTLLKLLRDLAPTYVCVAFDTEKPTYRHRLFEAYKAHRPPMPDDLAAQLGWIKEITAGLGVKVAEIDGYEADDVMGTLARMAAAAGLETVLVTGDKDLLQLVGERTTVLMLSGAAREEKVFDEKAVVAKYGVPPVRLVDFFALTGDATDNVPGVRGIGEKTATDLVSRYGGLEAIYEDLDRLSASRARKALAENRDQAFASRELVTIHTEVPLGLGLQDFKRRPEDRKLLADAFTRLSFRSLMRQIIRVGSEAESGAPEPRLWRGSAGVAQREPGPQACLGLGFEECRDGDAARSAAETLECRGTAGVEVNLGDRGGARAPALGIGIACEGGGDHYFPLAHLEPGNLTVADFREIAGRLVTDGGAPKVTHDLKRAILAMRHLGLEIRGVVFDTLLARYLMRPGQSCSDLESVALDYHCAPADIESAASAKANLASVSGAARICTRRARAALAVKEGMEQELKDQGLWDLYTNVEMPLAEVLADMEWRGVRVDTCHLTRLGDHLDMRMSVLEKEAFALAGNPFNLNSPREVSRVLFDQMGLRKGRKTKTGYSTDVSALADLAAEHDLPRKILEYRQTAKLKSTYVDQLLRFRDPATDRIHARFNQTVAATGRLSSSDPNLQNIPIRDDLGAEIRKAFIPSGADWIMVSGDYSQVELRVVAHLSRDRRLMEAFDRGEDIHVSTAAAVFKVGPSAVTKAMRAIAKTVNFGIIYGMGVQALAKTAGLSIEEAKRFLEEHRRAYPELYAYIDRSLEAVHERGYVETILGRKRPMPNVGASEQAVRSAAERAAINTPVQGSAADIVKLAMLGVHRRVKSEGLEGGILIQVHDEILVECPVGEQAEMEAILYKEMTNAYSLAVPLKVDLRSGRNWYEAH
jgi:DNA polymerase-1